VRFASFQLDRHRFAGVVEGDRVRPVANEPPLGAGTDFAALATAPVGAPIPLERVRLLPVVPHPGKIVCLGLNYRGHAAETRREVPSYPVLFAKFADSLVGPHDPILMPPESSQVDFEAELAVVIGRPARRVGAAEALDAVAGYTIANDISMRDFQRRSHQWLQGKTWPSTTPLGPWLVDGEEIDHARGLAIRLTLNGEEMQSADTGQMLFDVATAVATISEFTPLDAGDLILMGTPEGIGARREPPVFLRPGDRVRVEIEGIGAIENELVEERPETARAERATARRPPPRPPLTTRLRTLAEEFSP
jgi:acylpyruvate hydrolase